MSNASGAIHKKGTVISEERRKNSNE